jgi:hypothetical protein
MERRHRGDDLRGLECESTGEDAQTSEEELLRRIEQIVGPVDECAQRLLPWHRIAISARKELEPVVEPVADLLDAQNTDASRSELECERDAVESSTDLAHLRRVVIGQGEL